MDLRAESAVAKYGRVIPISAKRPIKDSWSNQESLVRILDGRASLHYTLTLQPAELHILVPIIYS